MNDHAEQTIAALEELKRIKEDIASIERQILRNHRSRDPLCALTREAALIDIPQAITGLQDLKRLHWKDHPANNEAGYQALLRETNGEKLGASRA